MLNVAFSSELQEGEGAIGGLEEPRFSPDLKLFVGNLPFNVDSAALAGLFQQAGNVEMVEVCLFFYNFNCQSIVMSILYIFRLLFFYLYFIFLFDFEMSLSVIQDSGREKAFLFFL